LRLDAGRSSARGNSLIHVVAKRPTDFSGRVAAYALDPDNADRLWDISLKLIA